MGDLRSAVRDPGSSGDGRRPDGWSGRVVKGERCRVCADGFVGSGSVDGGWD